VGHARAAWPSEYLEYCKQKGDGNPVVILSRSAAHAPALSEAEGKNLSFTSTPFVQRLHMTARYGPP